MPLKASLLTLLVAMTLLEPLKLEEDIMTFFISEKP